MVSTPDNPTLIYVTNPMCAWCYGFTSVVRRLRALWQGRLKVQVLFGDLNAHATAPMLQSEKDQMAVSWHQVQERTYLPFDYRFFKQQDFVYNTEPACRALLCVRLLRPVLTLEVLRAIHSAFYADGLDIRKPEVLARIVGMFGISENLFLTLFESEEIMQQMEDEFGYVDDIGATTFPSAFILNGHGIEVIARGFTELHELEQRILEVMQYAKR
ncbi:DsbA family protein [uncultured Pontibacter sp.]|uniref:DsbA family protein n=1 Tax=uncultured Pontibacter sp. TaxID=453356 RepID=UPI00261A187A|nr:DsbA family protein [uncultured Pontibacter sp.]